jgi:hypothetical protein
LKVLSIFPQTSPARDDFVLAPVTTRSTLGGVLASIGRVLLVVAVGIAALLHLWYRGVLAAPEVKRRKAARRAARRA